jgi:hypothetical protein
MTNRIEAFFTIGSSGPLGPVTYRAGYRCSETGNVVCALELPASIVESAIFRDAELAVAIASDGHIQFSLRDGLPSVSEPIDRVIAQTVSVDSLHLEEITSADLNSLLQRLCRSVAFVREAMMHLSGKHAQGPT